ncbi:Oidioi.mRNA.OKI2018_I69.chr2.g4600.t1.cds [Oikopleura dioica]|uniref:Oidioi.mRNA.OKI2018_I69.chr2.g4600.t1.cds n=1 Tax=Oikopleura dioica TaxID=34765 RepID=A0ABN7SXU9_OIKDI|nr:Oidioi.mRNA.OKI2018_I69.chr2.g4600.t1.cds [Oikopleura dioica]
MKILSSILFAVSSAEGLFKAPKKDADGNRIKASHPQRRLQALNQFLCSWSQSGLPDGKNDRFCTRMTSFINQLDEAFNREQCSFYDPAVKNGGPNPDEETRGMVLRKNPNAKGRSVYRHRLVNGKHPVRRRRRNADEEDCEGMSDLACDRLAIQDLSTCTEEDKADPSLAAFCSPEELKLMRSQNSSDRKLKRLTTGIKKWCDRYIYDCHGPRVKETCETRARNILLNNKSDS